MNLTAGYNADIARVYGINEALLLDAITFWERHSRRKDGYCWFTAEEFEVKTAIKPSAMKRAIDKLTAAGIIEVKNTYIIGTQIKCRHFKMIQTPKSEVSKVEQSDYTETAQSGSTETVQSVNSSDRTLTELYLPKGKCETPKTDEWKSRLNPDINELFEYWSDKLGYTIEGNIKRNRIACSNLIRKHGIEDVKKLIDGVELAQLDKYAPRISNFVQLQSKQTDLIVWGKSRVVEQQSNKIVEV